MTDEECYKILLSEQNKQIEKLNGEVEYYKNLLVQNNLKDVNTEIDETIFNGYMAAYEDFKDSTDYKIKNNGLVIDHLTLELGAWGNNLEYFCNKLGIERGVDTFPDDNGGTYTKPAWSKTIFKENIAPIALADANSFAREIVNTLKSFTLKVEKIQFTYMDCMGCECRVSFEDCEFDAVLSIFAYNKDETEYSIGLNYF